MMASDKLSKRAKAFRDACWEGGSVEKSGWAVIHVTSNDVTRAIFLGDKDKW